jgi:hypothetical protein
MPPALPSSLTTTSLLPASRPPPRARCRWSPGLLHERTASGLPASSTSAPPPISSSSPPWPPRQACMRIPVKPRHQLPHRASNEHASPPPSPTSFADLPDNFARLLCPGAVRSPCVQWSHIAREYGEEREHGGKGVLLRSPCFAQRFMHIRGVKRGLLETT